jgi:glutaconate CoA-transferase subunit A
MWGFPLIQSRREEMMSINLLSLPEAAAMVADGDEVAIAGNMAMAPMAFVRALVRRWAGRLRLVATPTAGINFDLLIGAGAVASAEFAQIAFGEHGLAPNFRRWVETGRLRTRDHT